MKYVNKEKNFNIFISKVLIVTITEICKNASPNETGGILIGYYSSDLRSAHIINIKQTDDSTFGRTWFNRGVKGLKSTLINCWTDNQYYLGEWHFHPGNSPSPSRTDIKQMYNICNSTKFNCPEPILLIIGEKKTAFVLSMQIFLKNKMISMFNTDQE